MMRKTAFVILLCSLSFSAMAQSVKLYDSPKLTPEVQSIRRQTVWKPSTSAVSLPASVDNSVLKFFPEVFEQEGGSCAQAAGMRYLFSYEMNRILDRDAGASDENVYSYYFTWNFLNEGIDQGGFAEQGFTIAKNHGVMSLADFPDPATSVTYRWETGYDKYIRSMENRVEEIHTIEVVDRAGIDNARRYLYDKGNGSEYGGVLSFSAYVSGWKMDNNYSGPSHTGYKSMVTGLASEGAHAMTIVGYDDSVEFVKDGVRHSGAFIGVNSYGKWWGDKGHFYIPYYFFMQDRPAVVLDHNMSGCTCRKHKPQVVFKVRLKYNSRNDLSINIGVADKPYASKPEIVVYPPICSNQGGDHPMRGEYIDNSSEIEIAFDFTEAVEKYSSYSEPKYFLNIVRSDAGEAGSGTLEAFSVLDSRSGVPVEYFADIAVPLPLKKGVNTFSVCTSELRTTSGSRLRITDDTGKTVSTPYVVRTENGNYAKMQVLKYDSNTGKLEIKFLYQDDGSRNIANPVE